MARNVEVLLNDFEPDAAPTRRASSTPASGRPVDVRSKLSDVDLIGMIARQDRDAFAELYRRHGTTSYRLAYRVTRNLQLAEAVVQEVFLAVWRQAVRFDAGRARPSTWLLTITHHKAVDVVRGEELRRTEPEIQADETADDSVDPHRDAWLGVQRDRVRSALATLTDPQREVIELAYFKGYSQMQLAHALEVPLGTIKSRTLTALGRLRSALEDDGITAQVLFAAG